MLRNSLAFAATTALFLALSGCATMPHQTGIVWDVNSSANTVHIGDHTFQVTSKTVLRGRQGNLIRLEELPQLSDADVGVRHLDRAEVRYRASQGAQGLHLDEAWVPHTPKVADWVRADG